MPSSDAAAVADDDGGGDAQAGSRLPQRGFDASSRVHLSAGTQRNRTAARWEYMQELQLSAAPDLPTCRTLAGPASLTLLATTRRQALALRIDHQPHYPRHPTPAPPGRPRCAQTALSQTSRRRATPSATQDKSHMRHTRRCLQGHLVRVRRVTTALDSLAPKSLLSPRRHRWPRPLVPTERQLVQGRHEGPKRLRVKAAGVPAQVDVYSP
jgi:hypothetical protein